MAAIKCWEIAVQMVMATYLRLRHSPNGFRDGRWFRTGRWQGATGPHMNT